MTGGTSKSIQQAASGGVRLCVRGSLGLYKTKLHSAWLIKLHYFMQCRWIISILTGPPVENLGGTK